MAKKKEKIVIGRSDILDLPELGIQSIHAKIDTGAYRASLHCKKVHELDGALYFTLKNEFGEQEYATRHWSQKVVRSSNGKKQKRYTIKTYIQIFGKDYLSSISLADRSKMKNPLLLGRKVLNKRFIVDVSKKNLSYEHKKKD